MKTFPAVIAKNCARFFVTVLSVALLTMSAEAKSGSTLIVKIQGKTKAGVRVTLAGAMLTKERRAATTESGLVKFRGLVAGTYTVTPVKKGSLFTPQSATVTFTADRTQTQKFTIRVSQGKSGISNCARCHSAGTSEVYADWLEGPHANFNLYNETTHQSADYSSFLTAAFAYPGDATKFIGFPYPAEMEESIARDPSLAGQTVKYCLGCHGPSTADNNQVKNIPLVKADGTVDKANHTQAARAVVGCEMCHGGGKNHMKSPRKISVNYAEPDTSTCGQCHNASFPSGHLRYHPNGAGGAGNPGIYEAYIASPHASSVDDRVYTSDKRDAVKAVCSKCHTNEGARLYKDLQGGDAVTLNAQFAGKKDVKVFDPVQCSTCHNSHNPSKLLLEASAATGTAGARSAEFNTCTNCHQLLDGNDAPVVGYHTGSGIARNHWDNPLTPDWDNVASPEESTKVQEGYNVNMASADACESCHNPHSADLTINKQWAESGHADLTGLAWNEDDWKDNGAPFAPTPTFGQQACQRCHTATGFKNRAANPDAYDAKIGKANTEPINDFSYLKNGQEEVLYCWACHKNTAFDRPTMATVKFPSGLSASMGDDSNLCMACHQGRAAKQSVDSKISKAGPYSFTNIHYFPAAAILFGTEVQGGYEYAGKTYNGRNTFSSHNGNLDTCIKCHARQGQPEFPDHTFEPQVSDCSGCHKGITEFGDIRPTFLSDWDGDGNTDEGLKGELATFAEVLYTQMKTYAKDTVGFAIVYNGASYPYFFKDTNGNGVLDPDEAKSSNSYNKFDAKLLEAAYNYQVYQKEPCAHIHNPVYIGQLLYDGIQSLGGDAAVAGLIRPSA